MVWLSLFLLFGTALVWTAWKENFFLLMWGQRAHDISAAVVVGGGAAFMLTMLGAVYLG